ncbi:MAG: hypothetical protein ACJ8GJ_22700 [Vitreoscilla sp.]
MTQLASDFDAPASLAAAVPFLAPTRHGALRLALRRTAAPAPRATASLMAAALLAEAEPLLQWLEDWLGEPLDPAPCEPPAQADATSARLHWRWGELVAAVDLPWPALLACRPSPELAVFWRDAVRWDELGLQLVLAHEALDDGEWQALQQEGAGWLLRESFTADGHWPCELRLQLGELTQRWPAEWRPARRRLTWSDAAPLPAAIAPECAQAVLAKPLRLTPPALLGWHGDNSCDWDSGQGICVLPAPRHGRRALAARLVPIGLRLPCAEADEPIAGSPPMHAGYLLRIGSD